MTPENLRTADELRRMSIDGQDAAQRFIAAYRTWVDAISTYGNGLATLRSKPACVTHADLFRKASEAFINAGECYW